MNNQLFSKRGIVQNSAKGVLFFTSLFFIYSLEAISPPTTRIVNSTSNDSSLIGTIPYWILNADEGDVIDCEAIRGQSITLNSSLPALNKSATIHGAGITINGDDQYQAFQIASGVVSINNLHIENSLSQGGKGGAGYSGGGGAVGGGGALYVHGGATVTLSGSSLLNNTARGGDGGAASYNANGGAGGGGGFGGGNGGDSLNFASTGGGGGGHSNGGNGGSDFSINGTSSVYFGGGGGGGGLNMITPGGSGGNAGPNGTFSGGAQSYGNAGGGAGTSANGQDATGIGGSGVPGNGGGGIGVDFLFGAGGGGGNASETGFPGGEGLGAGGGGGGYNYVGGAGGILGGGGGGGSTVGAAGGFGSGGGGGGLGGLGGGGFNAGGGNGGSDPNINGAGGGGSGLGGAIFIQSGGHLILIDAAEISGNKAIAGAGGASTSSENPGYIPPGDGSALGYDIFVREQGSITFNVSNQLTIATPIEGDHTQGPGGPGGLYKLGKGTLCLSGANSYSGVTSVEEGILNLNGSLIGNAIISPEAVLSGNATISGDLTSSGILAPGNSIGTISTTNLLLTSSSLLQMEVESDGTSDLITASGVAHLDGVLEVTALPGAFSSVQSYTILTAEEGVKGSFSQVRSGAPSLFKVTYDPSAVFVELLPLSALGLRSNAEAAAFCYFGNGMTPGSDVETVNNALLTLDIDKISDALNQIQPSQFSGLVWSQIENTLWVRFGYFQRLEEMRRSCNCCNRPCVWIEGIGAWQKQNSDCQQFGYTDSTAGATVGLDAICSEIFTLGAAASYTHSHLKWHELAGHAHTDSYYGGLYSSWSQGCGYLNAALIGAYSHYKTDRHLHFSSIHRHAKASYKSVEGLAGLEAGWNFDWHESIEMTPFVALDYVYLSRKKIQEKGAQSLNLQLEKKRNQVLQTQLGVILTGRSICSNSCTSGTFVPSVKLSYINDSPCGSRYLNAHFLDSDCQFKTKGLYFGRNLAAVSLGLTYLDCNDTLSVTCRYDGQFNRNYSNQSANVALYIKF